MGTKQSSLANKNKHNENKSNLKSAKIFGKRGLEETPKNHGDLVIVERPTFEDNLETDSLETNSTIETEESEDESEDEFDQDYEDFRQERARILKDAQDLKKTAVAFYHPEAPVEVSPECLGRNYFSRPSALDQESVEEAEERAAVLADAVALKKTAIQYYHPEAPVEVSPECFGRNYFSRPSALDQGSVEEAEERAAVLADAVALKKNATQGKIPSMPQKIVKVAPAMGFADDGDLTRSASSVQLFGLDFHDSQAF
eukprot:CAMPEP_0197840044 /NCGR_PEP_ID=MMETSP1437-20131217/45379_1 /TAXON_ID=49252 ORGANISM="Eucampia antarctica, Strain CCMP1452" /NCGR_SAMPLE_ID=MMETSP1437 /ASSEMBLY_ACC=CAM_ASM_001096 /LENGTH=256 /DNA_ID=CAMNT_0043449591 /DNA_START=54 /DNA_END=824 /DNA_ORIENTATION=-